MIRATFATFCDRAVLINDARIVSDGPAEDVADCYLETLTKALA